MCPGISVAIASRRPALAGPRSPVVPEPLAGHGIGLYLLRLRSGALPRCVGRPGFEPGTSWLRTRRSASLIYQPMGRRARCRRPRWPRRPTLLAGASTAPVSPCCVARPGIGCKSVSTGGERGCAASCIRRITLSLRAATPVPTTGIEPVTFGFSDRRSNLPSSVGMGRTVSVFACSSAGTGRGEGGHSSQF